MCKLQEQAMERAGEVDGIFTAAFNTGTLAMSGGTMLYDIHMHDVTITPTGFHYKGALIKDAGEAHRAFVAAMNRPVIMPGQPDQGGAAVRGEAVAHPAFDRDILYTDFIQGEQVRRDDLWAITTTELKALLSARAADAPSEPSDEEIVAIARQAIRDGSAMWDHFTKDDSGKFTVPVLDPKDFMLVRAVFAAVKSRAADALDSQPTESAWAAYQRGFNDGQAASQPTVAAQQGSIADDALGEFIEEYEWRTDDFCHAPTPLERQMLLDFAVNLFDSRASSAPVAPIAPALSADDRLVSIHDGEVMQHSAYGEGIFFTHDCLREVPVPQQEGIEAGNGNG